MRAWLPAPAGTPHAPPTAPLPPSPSRLSQYNELPRPTLVAGEEWPLFPYIAGAQMGYGSHPDSYHATLMMAGGTGGICLQVFAGTFSGTDGSVTPPMVSQQLPLEASGSGSGGGSQRPRSASGSASGTSPGGGSRPSSPSSGRRSSEGGSSSSGVLEALAAASSLCVVGDASKWSPLPEVYASLSLHEPSPQRFAWCELSEGTAPVAAAGSAAVGPAGAVCSRPYKTLYIAPSDPYLQAFRSGRNAEQPTPLHVTFVALEEAGGAGAPGAAPLTGGGGSGPAAMPAPSTKRPTAFFVVAHNVPAEASQAQAAPATATATATTTTTQCPRCKGVMPGERLAMHELQCARHNALCSVCGACVHKEALPRHLHCGRPVSSGAAASVAAAAPCASLCASAAELAAHVRVHHTPFACPACRAGAWHPGEAYERHLQGQCPERMVHCPYPGDCGLLMRAGDLGEHMEHCGSKTCEHTCGYNVLRRHWAEHLESKCEKGRLSKSSRPGSAEARARLEREGGGGGGGGGGGAGKPPRH